MLTSSHHITIFRCSLLVSVSLLFSFWARSQDAVYVLKAGFEETAPRAVAAAVSTGEQSFEFHRNLIFFPARLNGKQGNFLLDTGAPTLLLNDRSAPESHAGTSGFGASGEVTLNQRRVESLEFAGQQHDDVWALGLDLRDMEVRTGRSIDGFVGYKQLWNRELRIDYPNRSFSVLKSGRHPQWEERAPDLVFNLEFSGHLPIVTLRIGKRRMRFILDTGAAVNLLDQQYAKEADRTQRQMNIQGLDGLNNDCDIVRLGASRSLPLTPTQREFVVTDLEHLQEPGEQRVAGILGSSFLRRYCVGIDYRRRKLYLWNPRNNLNK